VWLDHAAADGGVLVSFVRATYAILKITDKIKE